MSALIFALAPGSAKAGSADGAGAAKSNDRGVDGPVVAALYYVDYRYPDENLVDPDAPEGDPLSLHFEDPRAVSYLDPEWAARDLEDVARSGIDWILPALVDPSNPERMDRAVPVLVSALDRLRERGVVGLPKLAVRVDPRTLVDRRGVSGAAARFVHLATPFGRRRVSEEIARQVERVPSRDLARYEGLIAVVFAAAPPGMAHGDDLFEAVRRRFRVDFDGEEPFLIAERSWRLPADRVFAAGGALAGPVVDPAFGVDRAVTLGPGFDDSRRPGRALPVRDREQGGFYRFAWNRILEAEPRPDIVLLESWNGMHDGTAIGPTRETGRRYLEPTRKGIERLRAGGGAFEPVVLRHPHPRPRPDWSRGAEVAGASRVAFRPGEASGLVLVSVADGAFRTIELERTDSPGAPDRVLSTLGVAPRAPRYLYFAVSDHYRFDEVGPAVIELVVHDGSEGALELQYDSGGDGSAGRYRSGGRVLRSGTDRFVRVVYEVPDARFAGRQNGGADFRIGVTGTDLLVASVEVRSASVDRAGPVTSPRVSVRPLDPR